jgi:hypothetical protein
MTKFKITEYEFSPTVVARATIMGQEDWEFTLENGDIEIAVSSEGYCGFNSRIYMNIDELKEIIARYENKIKSMENQK